MRVEFYGVARERAGACFLELPAANTLGHVLRALGSQVPSLCAPSDGQRLHSAFLASLNGDRFVSDPGTPLCEEDCLLILSADAGG